MGISIKLNLINKIITKIELRENINQFIIAKKYRINRNIILK